MFTFLRSILVTLAASRAAWLVVVIGLATHIQAAVPLITFGGPDADVARGLNVTLGGISRDGSTVFGALDTGGFFWNSSLGSTVQPLPGAVKFSSLRGDVLAGDTFIWTKSAGDDQPTVRHQRSLLGWQHADRSRCRRRSEVDQCIWRSTSRLCAYQCFRQRLCHSGNQGEQRGALDLNRSDRV